MRQAPHDIIRRLHARDPLVDVQWDERSHVWTLYWDNQRICSLFHADDTPMIELCVDEILDIMGRYDSWEDGPRRIDRVRIAATEAKRKAAMRKELLMEESMKEGENIMEVARRGANPQVHISDNPLV